MDERSTPAFTVRIQTDDVGGAVVLRCTGELDVAGGPDLREALTSSLDDGNDVVVDLTNLTFIDSSGLGVLVGAHKGAVENGRRLSLRGARGPVEKVLRITGLVDEIPSAD